ncbi:MAG: hypothetical protein P1U77_14805, partial [Rubripirellula sp.]|nr:hypothetical protein [Rubripirellula sp.]
MTIHTSLRGFWFALGATAVLAGSSLVAFQLLSGKILPLPQNRFHATDEPASGSRLANTLVANTLVANTLVPTDLEESSGQPNTQNSETQNSE